MQSPHDKLFHFTFAHAAHAAGWLMGVAPRDVTATIDWSTLAPAHERLPGLRLRPHFADHVFTATRHDDGRPVLLLSEHKSRPDQGVHDQLLRYAVLLRRMFQQRHDVQPQVLAVVLQHGPAAAATSDTDAPRDPLDDWQPSLPFVVDDITRADARAPDRRGMTPLARLTLSCLNALPQLEPHEVPGFFYDRADLLRRVDRAEAPPMTPPMGADAVDAIGWYALAVTDVTAEDLSDTFGRILHRPEDTIMSTLERTFQKGRAEGKAEGRAEALLRQLHRRFGPLDEAVEARVQRGTPTELDAWIDRVLDAQTLGAVLDGDR